MRATSLGHAGILIETDQASIVCDPWFVPAFFGSWFVFPRNDQLPAWVRQAVERPDYLYISHLHADHLDLAFLAEHVDRRRRCCCPATPPTSSSARCAASASSASSAHGTPRPVELG